DGLYAGHMTLPGLHDRSQQEAVAGITAAYYCPPGSADVAELSEVLDDLLGLPCWPERFDGGPASLAALKHLTSELIGRLCRAAQEATLAASAGTGRAGQLSRYDAGLVVPRRQRLECALLKGVAAHYVMSRDGAAQVQARERELIAELAEAIRRSEERRVGKEGRAGGTPCPLKREQRKRREGRRQRGRRRWA